MSLPLVIRAAAREEFDDSADWYGLQQDGLGAEFIAEVERVFSQIAEQPDGYPIVRRDVREAPTLRFPYAIYYRVKATRIVVIAVFHCSRDPRIWQDRV